MWWVDLPIRVLSRGSVLFSSVGSWRLSLRRFGHNGAYRFRRTIQPAKLLPTAPRLFVASHRAPLRGFLRRCLKPTCSSKMRSFNGVESIELGWVDAIFDAGNQCAAVQAVFPELGCRKASGLGALLASRNTSDPDRPAALWWKAITKLRSTGALRRDRQTRDIRRAHRSFYDGRASSAWLGGSRGPCRSSARRV